jgi:hypothetical protein
LAAIALALRTADFLVVAECEHDRPPRDEPGGQQVLRRLEQPHHADLVVERAPPPHEAIRNDPPERRKRPCILGVRLDRHHVEVTEDEQRGQRGIAPAPAIDQTQRGDRLALQRRMHPRIPLDEHPMKALERGDITTPVLAERNRRLAHGCGQILGDGGDIEVRHSRGWWDLLRRRTEQRSPHHQHDQQERQAEQDNPADPSNSKSHGPSAYSAPLSTYFCGAIPRLPACEVANVGPQEPDPLEAPVVVSFAHVVVAV